MCVNAVTIKNTITSSSVKIQLFGQPRHRTPLRTQFLLNDVPDVDRFCHDVCGLGRLLLVGIRGITRTYKKRGRSLSTF